MEVSRLALVVLATSLLCFSTLLPSTSGAPNSSNVEQEPQSGSGDDSTNHQPTQQQEGLVVTMADSKPKGKVIKLYDDNNGTLTPLKDQQVQKWRIACPETRNNESLKLVFLLHHANFVQGDFLQFNKIRYEGYKSTPTVIDFDLDRDSLLVSHVTQEGKSDFDLRYVCPYSNFEVCRDIHKCKPVLDHLAWSEPAYNSLVKLCSNVSANNECVDEDPYLCWVLKTASICGIYVFHL